MSALWPNNSSLKDLPKKNENIWPQTFLHKNVHTCPIHDGQNLETTQMSIERRMDKQIMNEWTTDTHNSIDETQKSHTEQKKSGPTPQNLCNMIWVFCFFFLRLRSIWTLVMRSQILAVAEQGQGIYRNGDIFWGDGNVLYRALAGGRFKYSVLKTHWTEHLTVYAYVNYTSVKSFKK